MAPAASTIKPSELTTITKEHCESDLSSASILEDEISPITVSSADTRPSQPAKPLLKTNNLQKAYFCIQHGGWG